MSFNNFIVTYSSISLNKTEFNSLNILILDVRKTMLNNINTDIDKLR